MIRSPVFDPLPDLVDLARRGVGRLDLTVVCLPDTVPPTGPAAAAHISGRGPWTCRTYLIDPAAWTGPDSAIPDRLAGALVHCLSPLLTGVTATGQLLVPLPLPDTEEDALVARSGGGLELGENALVRLHTNGASGKTARALSETLAADHAPLSVTQDRAEATLLVGAGHVGAPGCTPRPLATWLCQRMVTTLAWADAMDGVTVAPAGPVAAAVTARLLSTLPDSLDAQVRLTATAILAREIATALAQASDGPDAERDFTQIQETTDLLIRQMDWMRDRAGALDVSDASGDVAVATFGAPALAAARALVDALPRDARYARWRENPAAFEQISPISGHTRLALAETRARLAEASHALVAALCTAPGDTARGHSPHRLETAA